MQALSTGEDTCLTVLVGVGNGVSIDEVATENTMLVVAVVLLTDVTEFDWKLPVRISTLNVPRSSAIRSMMTKFNTTLNNAHQQKKKKFKYKVQLVQSSVRNSRFMPCMHVA